MSWMLFSWQSVIAGVVTTLAVSIIMAVLGVALGFTVVKPTSDHPLSGLGSAFGIWSVISVVVSLAAGGLVAGLFSGIRGWEHGFMVWATVLLAATLFSGVAVGGAVRMVGSMVRSVGSGAASVATSVGGGAANLASSAVDHIKSSVDLHFDPHDLGDEIESVMRDSGVETLQPEFLKDQMREAKSDLRASLHQLRLNTDNYEQVINDFLGRQKDRLGRITANVDKDAAVTAVMNHRGIPRDEAEKMVDNALRVYDRAVDKAKDSLTEAEEQFVEAKEQFKETVYNARVKAEQFSSMAAKSALAAGLALIIGAVISCYAGWFGAGLAVRDTDSVIVEARRSVTVPMDRNDGRTMGVWHQRR